MESNVKYCKLTRDVYKYTNDLNPCIIMELFKIYVQCQPYYPPGFFYNASSLCLGKLKKHICSKMNEFVKNAELFENDVMNKNFKLSKKQLSRILKKKPKKISIYVAVIVYFLIQEILKSNEKNKLIELNTRLRLNLNDKSGFYFMQKAYVAVTRSIEEDNDNNNFVEKSANYIIDSFNRIDEKFTNVADWYENSKNEVKFGYPY
ncbi:MAG: hypothetical protein HDT21_06850 [Ruminococcus sp.]|nr:hypothetical protein [Ruminococcus sp.]